MIVSTVRRVLRVLRVAGILGWAGTRYFFTIKLAGHAGSIPRRAAWMQATSRSLLAGLGIQTASIGNLPPRGVLASNHLGYLDIIVLGALQPTVFLSKSEVRSWPVFGILSACAGTLFIRRDKKSDVVRFDELFAEVVNAPVLLGIFPEGTSTDGHRVLPFHSSLFAAAATAQWPVTPVWTGYETEGGSVENDVAYWGDMTFASHFLRLVAVEKIRAVVVFGEPLAKGLDRKEIARQLHRQVCQMAEKQIPGRVILTPVPLPVAPVPVLPQS